MPHLNVFDSLLVWKSDNIIYHLPVWIFQANAYYCEHFMLITYRFETRIDAPSPSTESAFAEMSQEGLSQLALPSVKLGFWNRFTCPYAADKAVASNRQTKELTSISKLLLFWKLFVFSFLNIIYMECVQYSNPSNNHNLFFFYFNDDRYT